MANKVMAYPIVRPFTNSSLLKKGILPETENPPVKETEPEKRVSQPTDITTTEYHEVADRYIDHLVATLEELQEEREDVDVEYSVSHNQIILSNCQQPRYFCLLTQTDNLHRPVYSPSSSHQSAHT